ncbi:MAG: von Willebrand factor type domain protein [Chlorobi bacterium]|nr:von Willebrand factor type domain protein [Chlorobiota bacterium]
MPISTRRSWVLLVLLLTGIARLRGQALFTPEALTNRPLGALNDASATGWNPSLLGITSSGVDVMLALPFSSPFSFSGNAYGAFGKFSYFGLGIIGPLRDSIPTGEIPVRKQYFAGFGLPIVDDYLWMGAGVRWFDGEGFGHSGEWSLSGTLHPASKLLASVTLANLTLNNEGGLRVNAHAAYRLLDWATLFAGTGYDKEDTLHGWSPFRLNIGLGLGIFSNRLRVSGQYDPTRSFYRLGAEFFFTGDDADIGGGVISDGETGGGGARGGVVLARYTTVSDPLDADKSDDFPTFHNDNKGWAPDRAYTPTGLYYKTPTNDAQASGDALIAPCDGTGQEMDTPKGMARAITQAGAAYAGLADKLKKLSPNLSNLYRSIRQEYYTSRVRNRELIHGDSLSLISRQGYTIGIQSTDASKFPEVSLIMQVTDAAGRNVEGLGKNDFAFRDSSTSIISVRRTDSSFNVPVDIVLILDCSGSMKEEIESVRANVQSFVDTMAARGADYRIGGVLYGAIIYDTLHPTGDLKRFKQFAANADAIGSDEITTLAIKAATEMNFRPGSQRAFILITDDWQVQDNARLTEPDLVEMLWNVGARLYTIGSPCKNNGAVMTRLALGREYKITSPFSSILDDIGADVTTLYQLVYRSRMQEAAPKVTILRGKVRDEMGRPAAPELRLKDASGRQLPPITVNPTTGEYETEIAEGMDYSADLSGGRYLPLSEPVDLRNARKGDTVVRDFTLRLPRTTLAGTVTDENGAPVSAEVRIDDASGTRIATVRSGADGHYETPLAEGRSYRLEAFNADYIPTPADLDARGVERGTNMRQDLKVTSITTAINSGATFKVQNIFFDFGKADLKPESFAEIDRLAALLNEYPRINVEIGAHTDAVGSDRDNQTLSQSRARSVVDYLIRKGIDESRLHAKGYGESVPVASNDNDEGRALNRRVEFKLVR